MCLLLKLQKGSLPGNRLQCAPLLAAKCCTISARHKDRHMFCICKQVEALIERLAQTAGDVLFWPP